MSTQFGIFMVSGANLLNDKFNAKSKKVEKDLVFFHLHVRVALSCES